MKNILRCGYCGGSMMPTFSTRGGRRYYYYRCCKDSKRAELECPVRQITAGDIEELVRKHIPKMLGDISLVMPVVGTEETAKHEMMSLRRQPEQSGRLLRFKGPGAAVGPLSEARSREGLRRAFRGKVDGCPLPDYGHHMQRYFSMPFLWNHFTVICEIADLTLGDF